MYAKANGALPWRYAGSPILVTTISKIFFKTTGFSIFWKLVICLALFLDYIT